MREMLLPNPRSEQLHLAGRMAVDILEQIDEVIVGVHSGGSPDSPFPVAIYLFILYP